MSGSDTEGSFRPGIIGTLFAQQRAHLFPLSDDPTRCHSVPHSGRHDGKRERTTHARARARVKNIQRGAPARGPVRTIGDRQVAAAAAAARVSLVEGEKREQLEERHVGQQRQCSRPHRRLRPRARHPCRRRGRSRDHRLQEH